MTKIVFDKTDEDVAALLDTLPPETEMELRIRIKLIDNVESEASAEVTDIEELDIDVYEEETVNPTGEISTDE